MRNRLLLCMLVLLSVVSVILACHYGAVAISWQQDWQLLIAHHSQQPNIFLIILKLRAPRVASAYCIGALLALAGVLMQVLLANPLADPYILGISSGSALAAVLAMFFGMALWVIHLFALVGALLAIGLVLLFGGRRCQPERVLLIGVVLAAGFAAVTSFVLLMSPNRQLHGMLFWLLGDLSFATWPVIGAGVLLGGFLILQPMASRLNVLAHGELYAKSLGIDCRQLRFGLFALASTFTAVAVSEVGAIGFVGLIVPHMVRLLVGNDHRYLIPMSVLCGGMGLTLADLVARTTFAPVQLPVGIITSLLGVPVFLYLLLRQRRGIYAQA